MITPGSSPERGSIGSERLPGKSWSLPYRLKAFPPLHTPKSSPERSSRGLTLPPAGPKFPPCYGFDGADSDSAHHASAQISPQGNITPPLSSPRPSLERSNSSNDSVSSDELAIYVHEDRLDNVDSSVARHPPMSLPPNYFPDTSRSASSPEQSRENVAIVGDSAAPPLRRSTQVIQAPVAAHEYLPPSPPPYQARLLPQKRRRNRLQRITPSHHRRQSFHRQLKVCPCERVSPICSSCLVQRCQKQQIIVGLTMLTSSPRTVSSSRHDLPIALFGSNGNHLEMGPFMASQSTAIPYDIRSIHRNGPYSSLMIPLRLSATW